MRPEAPVFICTKIFGVMNLRRLDKVVFGVGPNACSRNTGKSHIHKLGAKIMKEHRTVKLVEIPIGGDGFIWNRLHGEREDICDAILKDCRINDGDRKEWLQARLRRVDDAIDRLMSGSYGNCSKCGQAIDEARLDIDPAL